MIRTVFLGTARFAVPSLDALVESPGVSVELCVSQPDRPRRRRSDDPRPSPVKGRALEHGIPVQTPERIRDDAGVREALDAIDPDVGVVVAYGQIIPADVFGRPRRGTLNVHGSLLPELRGAAPVHHAILRGDERTGVTILRIDEEMDHGPVVATEEVRVGERETTPELAERLATRGADLLARTIGPWVRGEIEAREQDHDRATYASLLSKDDGAIDWSDPADRIERQTRAFRPWPGSYTWLHRAGSDRARRVEVLEAEPVEDPPPVDEEPGTVVGAEPSDLVVRAGEGTALRLLRLQPAGKQAMDAADFVRGRQVAAGDRLGPEEEA